MPDTSTHAIDQSTFRANPKFELWPYDRMPPEQQDAIFPPQRAERAMGITGFTLPTLQRWVTSPAGRRASLHAFGRGGYPGSGRAEQVMAQAGLDGAGQWAAVKAWAERCDREG